jgi:tetratricopeptide (TPR) repeat protein
MGAGTFRLLLLSTPLAAWLWAGSDPASEKLLRQGLVALDRGDLTAARRDLERASKLNPREARAWLALAQTYWKIGLKKLADGAAGRAAAEGGKDPLIQRGLAIFYTEAGQWERAARFESAFAAATGDREAAVRGALLYLEARRPDAAIETALRALEKDNHARLRNVLGKAYRAAGDPGKALEAFQEAIRLNPYEEEYYFDLAQLLMEHHNFDAAIRVLEASKRIIARSEQLELALGVAYYGQRRFPDAVGAFLRTIDLAPKLPQPYVYLARILEHAGDRLPELRRKFAAYAQANPKDPAAQYLYAKVLLAGLPPAGDPAEAAEAEAALRRALELKEDAWEPHLLLGTLLERKGEVEAAARELERSAALDPDNPAPRFPLARVYLALGRKEEAQRQRELFKELTLKQEKAIQERAASLKKFELTVK